MDKQQQKQFNVFIFGLPLLLIVLAYRHTLKNQADLMSLFFVVVAVMLLAVRFSHPTLAWRIFKAWMGVVMMIGMVVTSVILTAVYILVFTPVAIVLRLRGQDFMHRRLNKSKTSYWVKCSMEKTSYKQQF